jgi:hypothetical protein
VLAALTGRDRHDIAKTFLALLEADCDRPFSKSEGVVADADDTVQALAALMHRTNLSAAPWPTKVTHLEILEALAANPPVVPAAHVRVWRTMLAQLPLSIPLVTRTPVVLPPLTTAQEAAWLILLELEEHLTEPWCLIGGQMVLLHCAEHRRSPHRSTDDGDLVLGVWTNRAALTHATAFLRKVGFSEQTNSGRYGYRWTRDSASLDLLVPEGVNRQRLVPKTIAGSPSIETEGGRQALIRTERVPVHIGRRRGFVPRPHLLGAIVVKAAAVVVDSRDTDRHREDLVILADIAVSTGGLRVYEPQTTPHDRKRIRRALEQMPETGLYWRLADDREAATELLIRLGRVSELMP